jgi:uroporphyrinogen decarboxylase
MDPETWFQANLRIVEEFPDVIFVPSWWAEYGMAAEPSVLGARIRLRPGDTPAVLPAIHRLSDLDALAGYDVEADGFAALTLHRIRTQAPRILARGEVLPFVTARGPLCTAAYVRGTTPFMLDLVEDPRGAHALLDLCTRVVVDWLEAQRRAIGGTAEGIFLLDDIVGFVSERHYLEFAHPYLTRICEAFPGGWVKLYHNDAEIGACLDHLADAGFTVLNWSGRTDVREAKRRAGNRLCLMGNVPALEVAVRGTPEEVRAATFDVLEGSGGEGIILSVGGGVSPGMPRRNIEAMLGALGEFNRARQS